MAEGLAARGVGLGYGRARVLDDLALMIPPGGVTALLGPNGSGKSTLLRALGGLIAPQAGSVSLDGRPLARFGSRALARRIALLAQGAGTPEGLSVEALVRQGRYPHRAVFGGWTAADAGAVERALQRTGTAALRDRPMHQLSGGQRQRAWIAMTLAQESDILLLDEPTTYLDLAHQSEVLGLMRQLGDAGQTVVAVLHDLVQAARYADRIVLLREGRIIADGTPAAVLTPELVRATFATEITVLRDPETGGPLCLPVLARGAPLNII